jgi:formamidopyrimidine-DNA glycosylase
VDAITKHTHPVVFGRREDGCPRCAELAAGAEVRTSPKWEAVSRHRAQAAQDAAWFARHRAEARRLGYCPTCQTPATRTAVCTCFDW